MSANGNIYAGRKIMRPFMLSAHTWRIRPMHGRIILRRRSDSLCCASAPGGASRPCMASRELKFVNQDVDTDKEGFVGAMLWDPCSS